MALLDLKELGRRLKAVDEMIVLLSKRRMDYARQVGQFKATTGESIYRADIETTRVTETADYARRHGLNPHLAAAIEYALINESCKQQMIQLQTPADGEPKDEEERYLRLKRRLLSLTERICRRYDGGYTKEHYATEAYLEYERRRLREEIDKLDPGLRDIALDIGCGTGSMTFELAQYFEKAMGVDMSQYMVSTAEESAEKRYGKGHGPASFHQYDVETDGIPIDDASVSFVVLSLGTASDIHGFDGVLAEIDRVLKPGGRIFLSFYNAEALLYQWEVLPWPTSLAAHVNIPNQCLDVEVDAEDGNDERSESEVFSVYARPYRLAEVRDLLVSWQGVELQTYPALSPLMPNDVLRKQPQVLEQIAAIDETLTGKSLGAYIIATGHKP